MVEVYEYWTEVLETRIEQLSFTMRPGLPGDGLEKWTEALHGNPTSHACTWFEIPSVRSLQTLHP